jgi:hypothetical protein
MGRLLVEPAPEALLTLGAEGGALVVLGSSSPGSAGSARPAVA